MYVFEKTHLYYIFVKGRVYIRIQQTTTVTYFVNKVVFFNRAVPTVYVSTIAALELQFADLSSQRCMAQKV